MKTRSLKKRVTRDKTHTIARRLPDGTNGKDGKAPQIAADQQVDEVERTFSTRWEW